MKQIIFLLGCLVLSGCVAVMVQKEIQVRKDANGKVIETIEIERATQRGAIGKGLQFDHLKSDEADADSPNIYAQ